MCGILFSQLFVTHCLRSIIIMLTNVKLWNTHFWTLHFKGFTATYLTLLVRTKLQSLKLIFHIILLFYSVVGDCSCLLLQQYLQS